MILHRKSLGIAAALALMFAQICMLDTVASANESIVSTEWQADSFPLVADGRAAPFFLSAGEFAGVVRVAGHLQADVLSVTGIEPLLNVTEFPAGQNAVIIGTLGKSSLVDRLAMEGTIAVEQVKGRRETFGIQLVEKPFPGMDRALVIFGSEKRGTIYGMYELSKQMGVSPWYWWADAPIQKKASVFVSPGFHTLGEPKVKYRGIFINDEAPALRNWAKEKFGGHNHEFYDRVFELILRNKGNYLWPAMWLPTAFYEDDAENARLADEYGIILSTSHHEPMTRAHDEWGRFGGGVWNYKTNAEQLQAFWRGGVERMGDYESVVTVGMRGDGDEAMSEGTAVDLLKNIIADQRQILEEVTGRPAREIPQVWALYKEVQDYYERGMRVDDDILILFSDDNWGNIRILPKKEDLDHPGGYGMYYHVDYVGAPVSYRWQNVSQIERVWEQMNLTYQRGVDDLWILNVGDIKPMELPMSFFLDLAWDPDAIAAEDLSAYYQDWAGQQFGQEWAGDIAELLSHYTKYNARRTPEMLKPDTYSIENYREADRIVEDYRELAKKARLIDQSLPEEHRSAFYQLVLYPIEACSNVNEMYVAAGKNDYYATLGAPIANYYADQVKLFFARDAVFSRRYHELADGKWNHMMSQTHMGYTYWNHPPLDRAPAVSQVKVEGPAHLAYFVEYGKSPRWGWLDVEADWSFSEEMPEFNRVNDQSYYLDIINRGASELTYSIATKEDWIGLSKDGGTIQYGEKVYVNIDWSKAPAGKSVGEVEISGAGSSYVVKVPINNMTVDVAGFVEREGIVSFAAADYAKVQSLPDVRWIVVPNLGRTGSAVTPSPADAESRVLGEPSPSIEYTFTLLEAGKVSVHTYLSPTLNFMRGDGLKFAVAIDDEQPQIVNITEGEEVPDWKYAAWWTKAVGDHIKVKVSQHGELDSGRHTLKVWMIDPGVVIQKFVIDAGGLRPSYLGPPASEFVRGN